MPFYEYEVFTLQGENITQFSSNFQYKVDDAIFMKKGETKRNFGVKKVTYDLIIDDLGARDVGRLVVVEKNVYN